MTAELCIALLRTASTRADAATIYARALADLGTSADWRPINAAILERWSMSGLNYIKQRAWKLAQAKSELTGADSQAGLAEGLPTSTVEAEVPAKGQSAPVTYTLPRARLEAVLREAYEAGNLRGRWAWGLGAPEGEDRPATPDAYIALALAALEREAGEQS